MDNGSINADEQLYGEVVQQNWKRVGAEMLNTSLGLFFGHRSCLAGIGKATAHRDNPMRVVRSEWIKMVGVSWFCQRIIVNWEHKAPKNCNDALKAVGMGCCNGRYWWFGSCARYWYGGPAHEGPEPREVVVILVDCCEEARGARMIHRWWPSFIIIRVVVGIVRASD